MLSIVWKNFIASPKNWNDIVPKAAPKNPVKDVKADPVSLTALAAPSIISVTEPASLISVA